MAFRFDVAASLRGKTIDFVDFRLRNTSRVVADSMWNFRLIDLSTNDIIFNIKIVKHCLISKIEILGNTKK